MWFVFDSPSFGKTKDFCTGSRKDRCIFLDVPVGRGGFTAKSFYMWNFLEEYNFRDQCWFFMKTDTDAYVQV